MSRITAADRARRILTIIPWIAAHDGPEVEEVCRRFAVSRRDLINDLNVVFMVGTPPYTPDTLLEYEIVGDRVWVHLGDYFTRPLRLTPGEALGLLVAGRAQLAQDADGGDDALARAVGKLAASLGVEDTLEVTLGEGATGVLAQLRDATGSHHTVEIDYYSYGRDVRSTRSVDPARLEARDGAWYLFGHCHQADAERVFRVDRIEAVRVLDQTFEPPAPTGEPPPTFRPGADASRVTLRLGPGARWVPEYYPAEEVVEADDGSLHVTLAVTALPWLARLLVRLGPEVEVVDVRAGAGVDPSGVGGLRAATASRILARYDSGGGDPTR